MITHLLLLFSNTNLSNSLALIPNKTDDNLIIIARLPRKIIYYAFLTNTFDAFLHLFQ